MSEDNCTQARFCVFCKKSDNSLGNRVIHREWGWKGLSHNPCVKVEVCTCCGSENPDKEEEPNHAWDEGDYTNTNPSNPCEVIRKCIRNGCEAKDITTIHKRVISVDEKCSCGGKEHKEWDYTTHQEISFPCYSCNGTGYYSVEKCTECGSQVF